MPVWNMVKLTRGSTIVRHDIRIAIVDRIVAYELPSPESQPSKSTRRMLMHSDLGKSCKCTLKMISQKKKKKKTKRTKKKRACERSNLPKTILFRVRRTLLKIRYYKSPVCGDA